MGKLHGNRYDTCVRERYFRKTYFRRCQTNPYGGQGLYFPILLGAVWKHPSKLCSGSHSVAPSYPESSAAAAVQTTTLCHINIPRGASLSCSRTFTTFVSCYLQRKIRGYRLRSSGLGPPVDLQSGGHFTFTCKRDNYNSSIDPALWNALYSSTGTVRSARYDTSEEG